MPFVALPEKRTPSPKNRSPLGHLHARPATPRKSMQQFQRLAFKGDVGITILYYTILYYILSYTIQYTILGSMSRTLKPFEQRRLLADKLVVPIQCQPEDASRAAFWFLEKGARTPSRLPIAGQIAGCLNTSCNSADSHSGICTPSSFKTCSEATGVVRSSL